MKIITGLLLCLSLAGCVSLTYEPETGKLSYFRIGNQNIEYFNAKRKADGSLNFSFDKQQSQVSDKFYDTIGSALNLAEKAALAGAK